MKKILFILLLIASYGFAGTDYLNHKVSVILQPEKHHITVTDTIFLNSDTALSETNFILIDDLKITSLSPNVKLTALKEKFNPDEELTEEEQFGDALTVTRYRLFPETGVLPQEIVLKIEGNINYPVRQEGSEYARGFSRTPGIICEQGTYLAGSTYWIPSFEQKLFTYTLTVTAPADWTTVSQGQRVVNRKLNGKDITRWDSPQPMEEIYLIAAPFTQYALQVGKVSIMAFLRTPDENLASKYLQTTGQYMEMYNDLIGPYPFGKFALVENFWETGYGMPSFTLLGPQIIRFPFILHSSYPHELLHNWWGNSVYVNYEEGNWCEGITVYMADHLIKEQRGQGVEYRRATLQKFTDYVTPQNDFPLEQFLSRHDAASEAVGYGKAMMIWNMLREKTGDKTFVKGWQTFYKDNKYKFASFDDIKNAFSKVTDIPLDNFFAQWIHRTGAPILAIDKVKIKEKNGRYVLSFRLQQKQKEEPFELDVPVVIYFADSIKTVKPLLSERKRKFSYIFNAKPVKIEVDPAFNLMRKLNYNEIPPALSKLYGSDNILILLPAAENKENIAKYQQLASMWAKDKSKNFEIKFDNEVSSLPSDKAVWIFGTNNKYKSAVIDGIKAYGVRQNNSMLTIGKSEFNTEKQSVIVTARHPRNTSSVIAWLTVSDEKAVSGLGRKLLHYGKYSYLAFEGDEPANIAKGIWPTVNSPLTVNLSPDTDCPSRKSRSPLTTLQPLFSAARMFRTVSYLSDKELEGRGLDTKGIEKAAAYIVKAFKEAGLKPGGDNNGYFQSFKTIINAGGAEGTVKNIIGILPGSDPTLTNEPVVISAHYDHLGYGWPDVRKGNEGKIHPGADDNASGIAVLLELAKTMGKSFKPKRTIIFVAFTAEENGLVGSRYFVQHYDRYPIKKIIAALNLDTVGRLFDNKLLVLNSASAREWKFIVMGTGYVTGTEAEAVTQQLDASDQKSFIDMGIPAVQIFTGPHTDYHRPTDTADKMDKQGLVKVAAFVKEMAVYLSERPEPLTFTGKIGAAPAHSAKAMKQKGRKGTGLGTMPDFSYQGKGVKIGGITNGSPAAKAGLLKGDIIIKFGNKEISDLRTYASALKNHKPGDEVEIEYIRKDKRVKVKVKLSER